MYFSLRVLLTSFFLVASASAGNETPTLSSVADVKNVRDTPYSNVHEFVITGIVTYVSGGKNFAVRDQSGAIEFFNAPLSNLTTGDIVRVSGKASCGKGPWSVVSSVETIGHAHLDPPRLLPLKDLHRPEHELRMVKTTATVIDVIADDLGPGTDFLFLRDGQETLLAYGRHDPALADLIDAEIEITGVVEHGISSERKFVGTCLAFSHARNCRILKPAPADKFDYPPLPRAFDLNPCEIATLNRHVANGIVLAVWNPQRLLVKADDGNYVVAELSDNQPLPGYGDYVTIAGYPTTDLYRIILTRARVRINSNATRHGAVAEEVPSGDHPFLVLSDQKKRFYNQTFGKIISLRGVVRALPNVYKDDYLVLIECENEKIAIDVTAAPNAADGIALNSEIAVTGRLIYETTQWQPTDILPRITGVRIVIRKPDDIRVVSGPPWLTVRKLLVVVGVLLAALIGLYARSLVRKRYNRMKLKERTQLAVELHDSLSQALTGLACQIAGAQMDDDMDSSRRKLTTADQMLQSCRTELKNCLFDLRNDTMTETSFDKAIRRTLEPLADQAEIHVRFNVNRERFDDFAAHSILVMIRELVANAIRHGHAWTVKVAGAVEDGKLLFSVTDDGCGFDPASCPASDQGHFGLDGIRERIKRLNGTFDIQSHPQRRTKAVITIPITRK